MTPAIPLLTGWMCISLLFLAFPAWRGNAMAVYASAFVLVAALGGLLFDRAWQLLALGVLMIGAAAAVGARMAQDDHAAASEGRALPLAGGVRLIAWAWLLAGLLNAGIGLLQYFQHTAWLGELVNHATVGQVYGNLRQRNQYATLMNIALWSLWYLWQCGALQQLAVQSQEMIEQRRCRREDRFAGANPVKPQRQQFARVAEVPSRVSKVFQERGRPDDVLR